MNLLTPPKTDVRDRPMRWWIHPPHLSYDELELAEQLGVEEFHPQINGLVVGMNPGPRTDPTMPLFPRDAQCAAGRLLDYGGLTVGEYLGGVVRRNLCNTREWVAPKAARRARRMLTALFDLPNTLRVVLLGRKAAEAFDVDVEPWVSFKLESRQTCVLLPHPSGKNLVYNDPDARALTGRWIRWAALGEDRPANHALDS